MSQSVLQGVAAGNHAAVRKCIDEYGLLVWGVARRLSRTRADAEDATQEIFLSIWQSACCFDPLQGSDKVFIMMIARRRLIDRLRKTKVEPSLVSLEALDAIPALPTDIPLTSSLRAEHITAAFAAIRPKYRVMLELSFLQGLTHSEVASHLQLPLGTVKSSLRRGLKKVRELINAQLRDRAALPCLLETWLL